MKRFLYLIVSVSFFIGFTACKKKAPDCSAPENISDPQCLNQLPGVDSRPVALKITFKDSYFYDQNSASWMTVQKDRLSGGTFGITVPIYSNFLNQSKDTVLAKATLAEDQKNRPTLYQATDFNFVPFIEIVAEDGVDYLFDYIKRDLNNNVIYEKNGSVPVYNGHVILPLVNAMFDNQFYSTNASLGSRFVHSITFAAQSKNKKGILSSTIDFETTFQIPPTDFLVDYTGDMDTFSLAKRWRYYFKNNDYSPNQFFKFFTLKEKKTIPEQVPLDLKVVFQTPPELKIEQEVFFELPFDYDTFKTSPNNTIIPLRGSRFYAKKTTLGSGSDFKMNVKINNTTVPLTNTKELEYLNLPAGKPWNFEFYYNMTQNDGYAVNPLNGVGVLNPLKPMCWDFANSTYSPILEETSKELAIAGNGYISICHPSANKKVTVAAGASNIDLVDSWFGFFSYIPYNQFKKELGHFYGIKKVRFYSEGCFRTYAREVGTTSYILKSKGSAQCGSTVDADNGWVYYYAEKVFTVFDDINQYDSIDGLKPLLQTFSSRPTITDYSLFKFNGLENDIRHVY